MKLSLALSPLFLAPTFSWHLEVHNQIAFVAERFLNTNTRWMISQILPTQYNNSIGLAASWADTVSRTSAKYSYNWHWISAQDDPPHSCNLYYHRDCQEGGCVVSQIANQTQILEKCLERVKQGKYTPDVDCQQALMWIVHFVEDVAEPMHTSKLELGGNTFKVIFGGVDTNMHQTWDRHILYSQSNNTGGFSGTTISPYFETIYQRIKTDAFRTPVNQWANCQFEIARGTYCPELWAKDSNAIVCDYAYGRYVNGTDLAGEYARGAFHIVEEQLAKAAYRLAGWLNMIAAVHFGVEEEERQMRVGEL